MQDLGEKIFIFLNALTDEQGKNVYEDKKAIPFNHMWSLCKIEEDGLREKVFRDLSKGKKNKAKIQCYENYRKYCPKIKGNNKSTK